MDEITNNPDNYTTGGTWWDTTATTSTGAFNFTIDDSSQSYSPTYAGSILNFTTNTTWSHLNNFEEWPKGVSDASFEKKYKPKWHIKEGYTYQLKHMWD